MDPVTLLIIAAVGYFLYEQYVNGTTTAATTTDGTTGVVTGGLAAQVSVSGGVTPGPNNSLQANFIINGVQMPIAVVPNGDAYEPTSWTDITSTLLTNYGVTPSQLYALMSADYMGAVSSTPAANSIAAAGGNSSGGTNPIADATGMHNNYRAAYHGGGGHIRGTSTTASTTGSTT